MLENSTKEYGTWFDVLNELFQDCSWMEFCNLDWSICVEKNTEGRYVIIARTKSGAKSEHEARKDMEYVKRRAERQHGRSKDDWGFDVD